MKTIAAIIIALTTLLSAAEIKVNSPDGSRTLVFSLNSEGKAVYGFSLNGRDVIKPSSLGIKLTETEFTSNLELVKTDTSSFDETWEPVLGEVKEIRNNYKELAVTLKNNSNKMIVVRFRVFNDGLGFRYEFPEQKDLRNIIVLDEYSEFRLAGDHTAFWMPGDYDTNEYSYTTGKVSEIEAKKSRDYAGLSYKTVKDQIVVQTPLMMKSTDGIYINIHEAALTDFSVMQLNVDKKTLSFSSHLTPDALGNKAYLTAPSQTPWRTVIAADNAPEILESKTILNLNEPSVIEETEWIKPVKYVGIWWEMHVNKSSWNYADIPIKNLKDINWKEVKPNGRHGATTERTKQYIDFAAKHKLDAVLVEGWNIGWEDWGSFIREDIFDFVTPYPDFDVQEIRKYAESKGVKMIMHHETAASVSNYERCFDAALRFMKDNGYGAVKTGYVQKIIPRGEHHDGHWMVRHFTRTAEKFAENRIMLNAHESVRPTGVHRTYPNWIANEAARGNEFNAWSAGNPPEHETILPFTRLMGGPMDYTPGIFQIKLDYYQQGKKEQVHTTLAKQLALYVTLYSPLQMAADLPENYERFPDAFKFIEDVAADWDDTKIIEAEPGDYITIARKAKGKEEWFIGAITDENSRTAEIPLTFLDKERGYVATIYKDSEDAHYEKNPMSYTIGTLGVNSESVLKIKLAEGGGAAVSLRPARIDEIK